MEEKVMSVSDLIHQESISATSRYKRSYGHCSSESLISGSVSSLAITSKQQMMAGLQASDWYQA